MVKWGLTPIQSIQAATVNAGIETGFFANLIAVDDDPLQDISALERARFVMKGGRVYRNATDH